RYPGPGRRNTVSRYLARRLLSFVPTVFLASIIIFSIIQLAPGDPAQMRLGMQATPAEVQAERVRLGLDRPRIVRYVSWLSDVAHLRLGDSYTTNRPVVSMVWDAFPNTLKLTVFALILSIIIGFPMGIYAALHHNRRGDLVVTGLNAFGLSVPSFWIGILLILLFSVKLKWLPPSGLGGPNTTFVGSLEYLVMPVVTIALSNLSVFSRFVRSSMVDVLSAAYVQTARSKGLMERTVIVQHALRNAMLPVVTAVGIQFGRLLGGAVVTEAVFSYPGIGKLVVTSILNRDYPVVQATLMLVVVVFLITNLIVDLSYAVLDPTVKFE
ncbi:MAG TPA: ABC transporter permease, partial [Thermomicrobiales bacterium]|nr:ABC transporter permease [Thermomicrobiales bacterium]